MMADKAFLICTDISTSQPHLAESTGAGAFGPLIQAIIAMLMQALSGCGITPAKAAAMFAQQTGLVGRFHKGMLRRVVNNGLRKFIKDADMRAHLLEPITTGLFNQGPTTTEADIVVMSAEGPQLLASLGMAA